MSKIPVLTHEEEEIAERLGLSKYMAFSCMQGSVGFRGFTLDLREINNVISATEADLERVLLANRRVFQIKTCPSSNLTITGINDEYSILQLLCMDWSSYTYVNGALGLSGYDPLDTIINNFVKKLHNLVVKEKNRIILTEIKGAVIDGVPLLDFQGTNRYNKTTKTLEKVEPLPKALDLVEENLRIENGKKVSGKARDAHKRIVARFKRIRQIIKKVEAFNPETGSPTGSPSGSPSGSVSSSVSSTASNSSGETRTTASTSNASAVPLSIAPSESYIEKKMGPEEPSRIADLIINRSMRPPGNADPIAYIESQKWQLLNPIENSRSAIIKKRKQMAETTSDVVKEGYQERINFLEERISKHEEALRSLDSHILRIPRLRYKQQHPNWYRIRRRLPRFLLGIEKAGGKSRRNPRQGTKKNKQFRNLRRTKKNRRINHGKTRKH
jgi:hypothetical protein